MKAKVPNSFFRYISMFTLESMIINICYWANHIAFDPSKNDNGFSSEERYTIDIGGKSFSSTATVLQTWLIDILYYVIDYNKYGSKVISKEETLHLINLYTEYADEIDKTNLKRKSDAILYVMSFFGEQSRFQTSALFFEEFSREKYILDELSQHSTRGLRIGIKFKEEFKKITGYSTDEYSALIFFIFSLFNNSDSIIDIRRLKRILKSEKELFSFENILGVIDSNSVEISEIRESAFNRQIFYSKPFIKIGSLYIASNPYLVLSLFSSSNYWVMRNEYFFNKNKSQDFLNAFGYYFEDYLDEVLSRYLTDNQYLRIPEDKNKQADLYIKLNDIEILLEQKSALSMLGIKQSHPDVNALKEHMSRHWKKAITQLSSSQKDMSLESPIKIILVYEDYYKSPCLDEFFRINTDLVDDNKYWLVSIGEFEMLLYLYKNNNELFMKIVKEKDSVETNRLNAHRELRQLFHKYGIEKNEHLKETGIYEDMFDHIKNMCN